MAHSRGRSTGERHATPDRSAPAPGAQSADPAATAIALRPSAAGLRRPRAVCAANSPFARERSKVATPDRALHTHGRTIKGEVRMLHSIAWLQAQLPPPTDNLPEQVPEQVPASAAAGKVEAGSLSSLFELNLTIIIFVFGLLALILLYLMIRNERTTPFVMRIYVITILIFGSLLVVSSAYTTEQISPVIGFFGTIAGYILGRGDRPDDPK
jgi:hypothetical protein